MATDTRSAWAQPPGELLRTPGAAVQSRAWKYFDLYSSHPGYGATPATVNSVFRDAEQGNLGRQCDLFDDFIESDGHLRALKESRIGAVAGRDWTVQAGEQDAPSIKAALALERVLRDINFHDLLRHQLSATFYGFAASEIVWEYRDDLGLVVPARFLNAPHGRFRFDAWGELRLLQDDNLVDGERLRPGQWVVSIGSHKNIARAGIMRTAAWWALFKRMCVRDWIVRTEKFGIPNVYGVYPDNATSEAKEAILKAVRDVGEAGQAVFPESTRIQIAEVAGGDGGGMHRDLVKLCEEQMSKLITGATLTSDTGGPGSYALGKVHEGARFSLEKDDARELQHVFRQQIGVPFLNYNGFAKATAPTLKIRLMQAMTSTDFADLANKAIEMGCDLDRSQIMDELGFRAPARPEDALQGRAAPEEPEGDGTPPGASDDKPGPRP